MSTDCLLTADTLTTAGRVLDHCRGAGILVVTAESCTGGLIAGSLTAVAGSSAVIDRGFVTYSNQAKIDLLGVPRVLIETYGAVSAEVAGAMAKGALSRSKASLSISVTGVAGPGGGTDDKPVGLVYFGMGIANREPIIDRQVFSGDRTAVRLATVIHALEMLEHRSAQMQSG